MYYVADIQWFLKLQPCELCYGKLSAHSVLTLVAANFRIYTQEYIYSLYGMISVSFSCGLVVKFPSQIWTLSAALQAQLLLPKSILLHF